MSQRDDDYRRRQLELGLADIESAIRRFVAAMRSEGGKPDSIHRIASLALLGCEEVILAWSAPPKDGGTR